MAEKVKKNLHPAIACALMVIMLCWCSACSVFSSRARFFFNLRSKAWFRARIKGEYRFEDQA